MKKLGVTKKWGDVLETHLVLDVRKRAIERIDLGDPQFFGNALVTLTQSVTLAWRFFDLRQQERIPQCLMQLVGDTATLDQFQRMDQDFFNRVDWTISHGQPGTDLLKGRFSAAFCQLFS